MPSIVLGGAAVAATSALSDAYARADLTGHAALVQDARRAKGGVVGTDGKPVVSFRIDHGLDEFFSDIWPLFKERGIPCSVGVVTDCVENPTDDYEPTDTTWATLLAEHRKGFEVWSHSRSHLDPTDTGISVESEVLDSKAELEAQGFRVTGWQQPGIPNGDTAEYSNNWDGDWSVNYARLVMGAYGLIEMGGGTVGGATRHLPTEGNYDLGHYTLDGYTAAAAQTILDATLDRGLSTQWMMHPLFIVRGTATCDVDDVEDFLDHVLQLWDAGTIEVLTSSGLAFADPNTSTRVNLVRDGSFAGGGFNDGDPWGMAGGSGTGVSIETDGGHTGNNYLHLPATAVYTYVYQGNTYIQSTGVNGATFLCEAWARCTGSDTEARVTVIDGVDSSRLNYEWYTTLTAGAGWTRLRVPFSVPLDTTNLQVRLSRRTGTGAIDFDDVRVVPV